MSQRKGSPPFHVTSEQEVESRVPVAYKVVGAEVTNFSLTHLQGAILKAALGKGKAYWNCGKNPKLGS